MNLYDAQAAPRALLRAVPMSLWPDGVRHRRLALLKAAERAADLLQAITDKLDVLEGDPDLEPSMGAAEVQHLLNPYCGADQRRWAEGGDGGEREPDVDAEPSLGSTGTCNQRDWAQLQVGWIDAEAEHDGREPDADPELTLGWSEAASLYGLLGLPGDEREDEEREREEAA